MILAYGSTVFHAKRPLLPMCYSSNNRLWQGGHLWLKNTQSKKAASRQQSFRYLSWPVLNKTVQTSIDSTPAICLSLKGWAKIRPSADCTAKAAAHASANGKAHLWSTQNCQNPQSFASSSAWDTAAPSRLPQTSVKLTPERWKSCWKRQVKGQKTSIDSNWNACSLISPFQACRPSNWMSCTDAWPKSLQKRGETQYWLASQGGSHVGSHSAGGGQPFYHRPSCWATHPGYGQRTSGFGGHLLRQNQSNLAAYGRASSLSGGYLACLWADKVSQASQEGSRSQAQTHPQAAAMVARGSGQEAPKCQRQSVGCHYWCFVWATERHPQSHSASGYRLQDKHISSGKAQWDVARPADAFGQAYSQHLSAGLYVVVVFVAVEGLVQLGAASRFSGWSLSCDGIGFDQPSLDCFGVCSLSCACQRPSVSVLGRATRGCSAISFGYLPA